MSILWDVERALALVQDHTGPEPSDRRAKSQVTPADIPSLIAHLENIRTQVQTIQVNLTGRYNV